ncbi:MAG TPA: hypothetical protein VM032_12355, partial [Vicinamibacterales bacterium]|nr:hypothetical protein [Vicinamibacterales bacterium]
MGFPWDQRAFTAGDRDYLWLDVVLAAMWRGEWAAFEQHLREGLACEAYSYDTDDPADQDAVELATNEFRYDHELITAEETEAWLERVGLSVESWSRYFARQSLWMRWEIQLEQLMAAGAPTDQTVADDLPAEGICSGAFGRFATALAGRAAVHVDRSAADDGAEIVLESGRADLVVAAHRRLFSGVPDDEYRERLAHIALLDQVFERVCAEALTEEALEAQVE